MASSSSSTQQNSKPAEEKREDLRRYLAVYKAAMKGDWESAERLLAEDEDALTAYITPTNETQLHRAVGTAEEKGDDPRRYLAVYEAAMKGNWESAEKLLAGDKDAASAFINPYNETLLHIAVGTGKAIHFVEKLVELMPWEALARQNRYGKTALSTAATTGNTRAARLLVNKRPDLLQMKDRNSYYPVHFAALNAHKETLLYLMKATIEHHPPTPYADQYAGVQLLVHVITSGFFDVALDLVHRYPNLATFMKVDNGDYPLHAIATKPSEFPSGCRLNFWQRFIYSRVSVKLENYQNAGHDIENLADERQVFPMRCGRGNFFISVRHKLLVLLAKVMELVPHMKHIRDKKLRHHQALQLVKCLCKGFYSFVGDYNEARDFFKRSFLEAVRLGIHEVLQELVDTYPYLVWSSDVDRHYIFQIAVLNRHENVFNLIYQMSEHKQFITNLKDSSKNTILHLAGKLAPPHKLNLVSGAALQMQRELQWFKEVEKFVIPAYKEIENDGKKTAAMVFSEEHKKLVKEGQEWMKDTANSCTIAAALIATVVFAAAITVPGGNNAEGLPNFSKEIGFIIFAVSDAISLFTSTASLLMFLSILTSRYAEQDFLYKLPKRLIIGLVTLFLSITTMMITFSATLYLVFGHKKTWILIPVAALACLPVTLFVSLQFPLLVDVISSTFGPGIFGKQIERPFY